MMMRNYNMPRQPETPCGCGRDVSYNRSNNKSNDFVVAMAYVPWQYFTNVYDNEKALQAGTIFPELDLPFLGGRGKMRR